MSRPLKAGRKTAEFGPGPDRGRPGQRHPPPAPL